MRLCENVIDYIVELAEEVREERYAFRLRDQLRKFELVNHAHNSYMLTFSDDWFDESCGCDRRGPLKRFRSKRKTHIAPFPYNKTLCGLPTDNFKLTLYLIDECEHCRAARAGYELLAAKRKGQVL